LEHKKLRHVQQDGARVDLVCELRTRFMPAAVSGPISSMSKVSSRLARNEIIPKISSQRVEPPGISGSSGLVASSTIQPSMNWSKALELPKVEIFNFS